ELAAAALAAQPDLRIDAGPPAQVLHALTRAFLEGLRPELADAVRAASVMRRMTEPALEALLRPADARALFADLAALPFVEATGEGLALHDVVRDTVAGDLAARDPALHGRLQRRAWRFLTVESRATMGLGLWRQTADLLFLVQNPAVRLAFFPDGAAAYSVAPATPADEAGILRIAAEAEPRAGADLIRRWWDGHPHAFHVARDRAGEVAAFHILTEPGDVDEELAAADPVVAAWADHLRRAPVPDGGRVLFLRRWLGRETGEAVTPQVAACFLDVKRAYMELRPRLERLYTAVRDPSGYPYGSALGMLPMRGGAIPIGSAAYHPLLLEFGDASVDGWLARMIGVELGADGDVGEDGMPRGTVTIMFTDIVDSTALTERLGDRGFRALARPLDEGLRRAVGATGGVVIEGRLLGDGMMAVFTSARQAIECGVRCAGVARQTGLALRVGLHAGDVISEGGNVFGGAVNAAARVAGLAAPGEVLVTDTVRALARTSAAVGFADRGEHRLKGIADPQRLHAVERRAAPG
ncbi:MAG TPA: adenylate/guanylate cyclase domain-containing protein, partial [Miltoncostaea sp.]|nr:adenylate/guanylate cyclase domain-containing protein [Miltoncostaea sp.]